MSKVQLYNDDCLSIIDILNDNSIDLLLTDPPYGIDYQSCRCSKEVRKPKIQNDKSPFTSFISKVMSKISIRGH